MHGKRQSITRHPGVGLRGGWPTQRTRRRRASQRFGGRRHQEREARGHQVGLDALAHPGLVAGKQRTHDAEGGKQTRQAIGEVRTNRLDRRAVGEQAQQSAQRLADAVVGRAIAVGSARSEARHGRIHQAAS